jgi:hypothetical protein
MNLIRNAFANDTRDKSIAAFLVLCLFALAGDLWTRGTASLYGRFFLWLVEVTL